MKMTHKSCGIALLVIGAAIILCSPVIVFPGLERLLGIETIVGSRNVVYGADGSYSFTNPGAMLLWIASVAAVGACICAVGVRVLWKARGQSV
jgi:hypothetical protein